MELCERDQLYVRELLRSESANALQGLCPGQLQGRLSLVAEQNGVTSVDELIARLRAQRPAALHRVVAEAMTIKETSFFRDAGTFTLLRERILPKLILQRRKERRLRIWSAACATGQEAHSVAMLLCDRLPELQGWDVQIMATDISQAACDYAGRGRYRRMEINRGLPPHYLLRYFERHGEEWQVRDEVRKMVRFERGNVLGPGFAGMKFDMVLLRNVLLYFTAQDRARALRQAYVRMPPEAPLLLGNAEQAEDSSDLFRVQFDRESYFYVPVAAP